MGITLLAIPPVCMQNILSARQIVLLSFEPF